MRLLPFFAHSLILASFLYLSVVNASWTRRHMEKEHHVETWDATSFFVLHDLDHNDRWTANEVRTLYGLQDPDIPAQRADEVVNSVFQLFKKSTNDVITKDEFVGLLESGGDLPDCEFDGHHGDEEWEYEIHHVEQFHADDDRDESEWDHPEDIEHFRKHDEMYHSHEQQPFDPLRNIPEKFRRRSS